MMESDGVRITMLHLKQGSILVEGGQEVQRDQPIARIGNSGHTTVPHLHIQAARGDTWFGEPVPMLFDGTFLIRGDEIRMDQPRKGKPRNGSGARTFTDMVPAEGNPLRAPDPSTSPRYRFLLVVASRQHGMALGAAV